MVGQRQSCLFSDFTRERMLFEANQRLSATQRLLDKARLKDKSHVGVQRAGSLAAADRPARPFLVNSPRLGDSQKGGLAGARNRPERKTLGPKVKQNSSQTQEGVFKQAIITW